MDAQQASSTLGRSVGVKGHSCIVSTSFLQRLNEAEATLPLHLNTGWPP